MEVYMPEMYRARILLERSQRDALAQIAKQRKLSISGVVRQIIAKYLIEQENQDCKQSLQALKVLKEIREEQPLYNGELVAFQLRFTRSEFKRALHGLTEADAQKRFMAMNCISWNIGHLAWQEQRYFLYYAQSQLLFPQIDKTFCYDAPASTPALGEMWEAWSAIALAADLWLDTVTIEKLQEHVVREGKPSPYLFGSMFLRVIYHYWYHTGENLAIRQLLGHTDLPEFVGDINGEAPYRPEL